MRHILRRALLATVLPIGTMLAVGAPADAGGPTSVLVTNPAEGRAAAIYYSDPRYEELDQLLHGSAPTSTETVLRDGSGESHFNLTWLAHDVSVWRTDQVVMQADGQVWVDTEAVYGDDTPAQGAAWSQVADGERFRRLVTSLGLLGPGTVPTDTAGTAPEIVSEAETSAPTESVVREETRWFSLTGWRWAVPGLLVGLLAAARVRGRRDEPARPRRELIEGAPERITSPG